MSKVYEFTRRDPKTKEVQSTGRMTLNSSETKSELFFYGDICGSQWDCWTIEDQCPQDVTDFLNDIPPASELDVYINSGGGDVFGGIAIYNILRRHTGKTTAHIDGVAASIASVIALACDDVVMHTGSQYMIHKPWSWCVGSADDMLKTATALDQAESAILDIYSEHAADGVTRDDIKAMVDRETWFTGAEAAQVFRIRVEQSAAMAASWSVFYDQYKHAPKVDPPQETPPHDGAEKDKLQLEIQLLQIHDI